MLSLLTLIWMKPCGIYDVKKSINSMVFFGIDFFKGTFLAF
jgi:hypothetical protein